MKNNGLLRCNADYYCYFKKVSTNFIILLPYVDDMLVERVDKNEINKLKKQLSSKFDMKDLHSTK